MASGGSFPLDESMRLSAFGKFWRFPESVSAPAPLVEAADGCRLLAQLLYGRGATSSGEAVSFLDPTQYVATEPSQLPDLDRAVERIFESIAKQEKITIYGDYDVDGVTGTSVLLVVLRKLGAVVDFYIPNRATEGYGLNLKAVSILASKHRTKLIISCDCGVSNFAEINFAKSLGVDSLVLDHHSMPDLLPPAVAIVHPKRLSEEHPLFHLPGVGVAYKVCEALLRARDMGEQVKELLDYVTLGMIADLVPLIRENRYLVKIGLPELVNSKRPGIRALLAQVRKSDDTDLVGFGLAPRINAVGRLADARVAVELLTTDDEERANELARQLQSDNTRRQELCEEIFQKAERMVTTKIDLERDRAIVIYDEGWHHGVVGIVASRLVERFHRPVFIGELDTEAGVVKGSARSVESIDLYQVLKANEHLMTKWGGHKMAAGFSVEASKAQIWSRALTDTCNRLLADKPLKPYVDIEAFIRPAELSEEIARSTAKLAPFGMWNKKPLICIKSISCAGARVIGKDAKHHRIMLEDADSSTSFECVMWNTRGIAPTQKQVIDVVFTPEINEFNGRQRLQLVLMDWRDSNKPVYAAVGQASAPALDPGAQATAPALDPGAQATAPASDPQAQASSASNPVAPALDPGAQASRLLGDASSPASNESESDGADSEVADLAAPAPLKPLIAPAGRDLSAQKMIWKDLREHENTSEILAKAVQKFGVAVNLFSELSDASKSFQYVDRLTAIEAPHLVLCQFPASSMIFQDLLGRTRATTVYLLGHKIDNEGNDAAAYLRKLLGLVKFAVNQREGQVYGEKLAALLGSTKMSVALALTILKKVNVIDWFSEDGYIYLDLIGAPVSKLDDLPEYKQLVGSLAAAEEFRDWCRSMPLKEIQLSLMPNSLLLGSQASTAAEVDDPERTENEHANRDERARINPSA